MPFFFWGKAGDFFKESSFPDPKNKHMLHKLIFGFGLTLLTALPLAAQTSGNTNKQDTPPLEQRTDENPQYQKRHRPRDYEGSREPQTNTIGAKSTDSPRRPAAKPAADSTASPAPAPDEKKKPQRSNG